jgi:hypothetical protein
MNPHLVAAAVVILLPCLWLVSSGERLAMCDGDLVVTRYWLGGERIMGRLDGGAGHWWLVHPDGSTEPYNWEIAPAVLKVSPKVSPRD